MHVGQNLYILSEIYESEKRDAQVDGSLSRGKNLIIVPLNFNSITKIDCVVPEKNP